jgi:hypothetical protein
MEPSCLFLSGDLVSFHLISPPSTTTPPISTPFDSFFDCLDRFSRTKFSTRFRFRFESKTFSLVTSLFAALFFPRENPPLGMTFDVFLMALRRASFIVPPLLIASSISILSASHQMTESKWIPLCSLSTFP